MTKKTQARAISKRTPARAKLALRLSSEQKRQVKEATGKNLDSIDLIDVEGYLKAAPAAYRPEPGSRTAGTTARSGHAGITAHSGRSGIPEHVEAQRTAASGSE
jgi:hypothetical protein